MISDAIQLSILVALGATVISMPFAIFIAYILARTEFTGKQLLNGLVHLPLILPPVVTGYVLLVLLGRNGIIGKWLDACCNLSLAFHWTGAVIAASIMAFPLMVRAIRQAIEAVDPQMELAARSLGANPFATFWRVTIPLASPGIWVGAILCFAKAMGEFGATITFVGNIPGQTQTLPLAIHNELESINGTANVIVLAGFSIAVSIIALVISEKFSQKARRRLI